mmetsp:Transcript_4893/g.15398  ORF Transcript_4893/g.15398 Transcript_4893/m.15398 type:complete len:257 (+) Transcript_4893:427-1197(+)
MAERRHPQRPGRAAVHRRGRAAAGAALRGASGVLDGVHAPHHHQGQPPLRLGNKGPAPHDDRGEPPGVQSRAGERDPPRDQLVLRRGHGPLEPGRHDGEAPPALEAVRDALPEPARKQGEPAHDHVRVMRELRDRFSGCRLALPFAVRLETGVADVHAGQPAGLRALRQRVQDADDDEGQPSAHRRRGGHRVRGQVLRGWPGRGQRARQGPGVRGAPRRPPDRCNQAELRGCERGADPGSEAARGPQGRDVPPSAG